MTLAIRLPGKPSGHRSSYFVFLSFAVAVLSLFGLVMVLSASAANALRFRGSSWYYFRQQLLWLGLGTLAMIVTMRVDYRHWRRITKPLMIVSLGVARPGADLALRHHRERLHAVARLRVRSGCNRASSRSSR